MTKNERLAFIKQSLTILKGLSEEINEKISHAQDGVAEDNANLIIGGLAGIDQAAEHLKNIYQAMLFVHRG
ncbi:MAG: hypothetical protein LBM71_05625 [Elusimicrobiota bacterium]|jgi:hypothetical protein|nr:hypothetical protein [Elusimicrobiota bacterium]